MDFRGAHITTSGQTNRAQKRSRIPFRAVNKRGSASYDASFQRHHLLPRQLLSRDCFATMFAAIGRDVIGFDDFRHNGLLLPATDAATFRSGMPLHRGPHRSYNEVVMERVGRIEANWTQTSCSDAKMAMEEAVMRLRLLQSALRKRLLQERRRFILNRKDPLGTGFNFTELDAMAEALWKAT